MTGTASTVHCQCGHVCPACYFSPELDPEKDHLFKSHMCPTFPTMMPHMCRPVIGTPQVGSNEPHATKDAPLRFSLGECIRAIDEGLRSMKFERPQLFAMQCIVEGYVRGDFNGFVGRADQMARLEAELKEYRSRTARLQTVVDKIVVTINSSLGSNK